MERNMKQWIQNTIASPTKKAVPVLSFPGVQLIDGTVEQVKKETRELLERCSKYPNFVISSGCDIPSQTPMENLEAFFETVKEFYS